MRRVGETRQGCGAGKIDDVAARLTAHELKGTARAEERAVQMDSHHSMPSVVVHLGGNVPMARDPSRLCPFGHLRFRDAVERNTDLAGMSTTLCGSLMRNGIAYWIHVGDSRLYLLRNNKLMQITRDHNLAQYLLDNGEITAEEARQHPARHHLYQCVGCGNCQPDSGQIEVQSGDLLVHTTDGINEEVSAETITSLLTSPDDIQTRAKSLIQAALDAGGKDNITVAMAEI